MSNDEFYLTLARAIVENFKAYDATHGTFYRQGYDTDADYQVLAGAIEQALKDNPGPEKKKDESIKVGTKDEPGRKTR